MKKLKNQEFTYYSIIILLGSILLISLLNFTDILGLQLSNALIYIIFFILLILNSFKISLKSNNKGIITGLKIASIVTLLIIILKLILGLKFSLISLIYIVLIYISSIISSIYGKNKKSSNS